MIRLSTSTLVAATFAALVLSACGGADTTGGNRVGGTAGTGGLGGGGGTGGASGASGFGGTGGFGGSPTLPPPQPVDGGVGGGDSDGGCESITNESPVERGSVDIIWIIDNSGSMFEEYTAVKNNLNAFANDIQSAGIDHHVVMITGAWVIPFITPAGDPAVGTALGMDPMHYRYIAAEVGSNNVMDVLAQTFPQWQDFLRPEAPTHIVVTTDDNQRAPFLTAAQFQPMMEGLNGHSFIYHSVASEDPKCPTASSPGIEHYALSDATGGLKVSICISDWSQLFMPLKDAVVTSVPLPCNFTIPEPPDGKELDAARVNFAYTPTGGAQMPWPRAAQQGDCGTQIGWYYDDPTAPTTINLCPAACDVAAQGGGRIDIIFGCAAPPVLVPE